MGYIRQGVWLPLAAWLSATATVAVTCAFWGQSPVATKPWIRWDSFQYLDMSQHGYTLVRCVLPNGLEAWCGNSAWFPAYPAAIWAVAATGVSHEFAGVALSWSLGFAGP